jgi:uncharacterized membrane protein
MFTISIQVFYKKNIYYTKIFIESEKKNQIQTIQKQYNVSSKRITNFIFTIHMHDHLIL